MQRRKFGREVEAVRLVKQRGVSVAQAARDLDVHENVLRKWVREFSSDPVQAFPGPGQMKGDQIEIERLRKEVARLKAEREPKVSEAISKKRPRRTSRGMRYEVRLRGQASLDLAGRLDV